MSFVLITVNWLILLAGAIVFLLLAVRSRSEEERLLARFGQAYTAYRARTGRFVPKPSRTPAKKT